MSDAGGSAPKETVDDATRRLRDTVDERLLSYLEVWRDAARAWDRREYDSKHFIEDSTALFEYAVRDWMYVLRGPIAGQPLADPMGLSTHVMADVPVAATSESLTVACGQLRHARENYSIPQHAIAVTPNPVVPGTRTVTVSFDGFGKPAGAYVGKLLAWAADPASRAPIGDVIVYVGGTHQRF